MLNVFLVLAKEFVFVIISIVVPPLWTGPNSFLQLGVLSMQDVCLGADSLLRHGGAQHLIHRGLFMTALSWELGQVEAG